MRRYERIRSTWVLPYPRAFVVWVVRVVMVVSCPFVIPDFRAGSASMAVMRTIGSIRRIDWVCFFLDSFWLGRSNVTPCISWNTRNSFLPASTASRVCAVAVGIGAGGASGGDKISRYCCYQFLSSSRYQKIGQISGGQSCQLTRLIVNTHPDTGLIEPIVHVHREELRSEDRIRSDVRERRFGCQRVVMRVWTERASLRILHQEGGVEGCFCRVRRL